MSQIVDSLVFFDHEKLSMSLPLMVIVVTRGSIYGPAIGRAAFGRSFLTCLEERLYGGGVDNWQGDWVTQWARAEIRDHCKRRQENRNAEVNKMHTDEERLLVDGGAG